MAIQMAASSLFNPAHQARIAAVTTDCRKQEKATKSVFYGHKKSTRKTSRMLFDI